MAKRHVWRITKSGTDLELTDKKDTAKRKSEKDSLTIIGFASQFGVSLTLPIVGGAFLGKFLDAQFGSEPRITLSCILLGIFLSCTNGYFLIRKIIT